MRKAPRLRVEDAAGRELADYPEEAFDHPATFDAILAIIPSGDERRHLKAVGHHNVLGAREDRGMTILKAGLAVQGGNDV